MALSAAGVLAGTPAVGGDFPFAMTVTDASGAFVTVQEDLYIGGGTSSSTTGSSGNPQPNQGGPYTLSVVGGTIQGGGASASLAPGSTATIVAAPAPAGEYFTGWSGAAVASVQSPTTTLVMPSSNTQVTASFGTPAPVPYPVSGHPRLWITQQDLPRLQQWAVSSNPAYQGLSGVLSECIADYQQAFPGAALTDVNPTPASPFPDLGDSQGYSGMLSEQDAMILAFNSLIDPNPANRAAYAQAARNLLMNAMNQAALGHLANAPFRDPLYAVYNRGSWSVYEWPLVVDWIYPILSDQDKATIRTAFMIWANDCLNASTTGGDNPGTPGVINSLSLLPNNLPYRMASNNYFLAHARLLTLMALCMDPQDDPGVNPQLAPSQIGNSLRSYIADATGAWLYEEYAMMGEPSSVAQSYGIPNNPTGAGFGLASGGLPPEGFLYGESYSYILGQLLGLQTAGFNNPALSGPQIGLIGAPVWDRYVTGYLSSLTAAPQVPATESWLGSVYSVEHPYGDMLRLWVSPDEMQPFALLSVLEQETGSQAHSAAARWFVLNAMPNGSGGLLQRMADPWTWGVAQDVLYYLLLDPSAATPSDPRPNFPTQFYDAPAARLIARTDWSAQSTQFDYRAGWISINHQDGGAGMFSYIRKGEVLTKPMTNYDAGGVGAGMTTTYNNSLALQNWTAIPNINWSNLDLPVWTFGSQWMLGEGSGDPTTVTSSGPGYTYVSSDLTKLYNKGNPVWTGSGTDSVSDIVQATRSILWLSPDAVVIYDRATSLHSGLFKVFNLALVTQPTIAGSTATEVLPSGQQLSIQTLLPAAPSLTQFNGAQTLNPVADLEPTQWILQVQDPTLPADTRFLHVLQGADPGATVTPAQYRGSASGTPFDGAEVGGASVWFPVDETIPFGGVSLPVSQGVRTLYVTGLTPGESYTVSQVPGSPIVVNISAGPGGVAADGAGVLQVQL